MKHPQIPYYHYFFCFRWLILLRGEFLFTRSYPFDTTDWIHVVFNFHGKNKSPEYGFYYDGERQTSETQELFHRLWKGAARDGRILIGKYDNENIYDVYGTFVIDELVFFSYPLTEPEIKMLILGN